MISSLDLLVPQSKIFIDTNIFLYGATYAVIRAYPLVIYSIDKAITDMAVDLSSRYGLFISDASHLAVMKMNGISNIVTNDNDFQLAEDINIYKP